MNCIYKEISDIYVGITVLVMSERNGTKSANHTETRKTPHIAVGQERSPSPSVFCTIEAILSGYWQSDVFVVETFRAIIIN